MNSLLNFIRNQWHPLYRLRKNRIWRAIQRYLDPDFSIRICKTWVSVKLLRDLSLFFPHDGNEPSSMLCFRNIIKDQSIEVFFDIGANLGQYTWNALDAGVNMAFLFEPDTTNQRLIFKTIHKNKISNSYLWPIALGEQVELSKFLVDDASGSVGSIDTLFNSDSLQFAYGLSKFRKTPVLPLDVFTKFAAGKKTLLKIDVEGAEGKILEAGQGFIAEVHPYILIECFEEKNMSIISRFNYTIVDLKENSNYLLIPN